MKKMILAASFAALSFTFFSCEKDQRIKPDLSLKADADKVHSDTTLAPGTKFKVAVEVKKTEDELKTYNVSAIFDSGNSQTIVNETLEDKDEDGFKRDHEFTTRSQAGIELYQFNVTDRDGNIATSSFTVLVK